MLFKTSQEFLLDLLIIPSISHITFFSKLFLYHVLLYSSVTDTGNAFLLNHIIMDIFCICINVKMANIIMAHINIY